MTRITSRYLWFVCLVFFSTLSIFSFTTGCLCPTDPTGISPGELTTDQPNNTVLFTNITLNKSSRLTFTLFNKGLRDVTIESATLKDTNKVFSIVTKLTYPLTLKPGEANGVEVTVQFLTKKAGDFRGSILFASSDAFNVDDNGNFEVKLRHRILNGDPVFICGRTLDFGAVAKGKTKEMECELKNRGNAELNVTEIKYIKEEGSDADFVWLSPKAPFKLKPNNEETIKVKIAYKPSDYPPVGDKGAFVLIGNTGASNEKDAPRIRVIGRTAVALIEIVPIYPACTSLAQCQGIDKRLKCTDDSFSKQKLCRQDANQTPVLKFPLTSKGKTTKRIFEIRSIGDLPLKVDNIEPAPGTSLDFNIVKKSLQFPLNLDPKQVKEIVVEYSPSDDKEDKGQLVVSSNAGNKPKAPVILEAASRGCNLEVTPGSRKLKFPAAKSFKVTVFNVGNESCLIKEVVLKSGKSDPFSLIPVPQANTTIAPNGRLDFLVKFSPKSKTKVTDAVVIKSSDPDEPEIEIVLEGELTGTRECELAANPASLNFGLVPVGRSRQQSVVIENKGWGDCKVSSANVVGTNPSGNTAFTLTSRLRFPLTITSGATVRLDVSYTPPASRPGYEGNLTLQSNDSVQSTFNVKLQGSSGNLCLEIVPTQMDFGSTKFGCATPKRDIEVFNLGATGCSKTIQVTKIGLGTKTSKEFRIMSAPTTPITINAGQSFKIGMSYKANDLGTDTGVLNIGNNIPGQNPIPVPLVGEGIDTDEQKDVFKQLSRPKTDILFVIDDSCSMGDEQANLAKNFQSFINWAIRLNVDYQIGVTTTDITGRRAPAGCLRGSVKIVKNSTPNPILTFQTNVKVGTSGSASEKGLEAAYKALSPPVNNSPQCNRGFYRQDASLSLIFVSDEPDQSPQTVQFYISFFRNLKGFRNLDFIRASAVVGPPPSGCRSPGSGSASSGPRYWEVAKQLKGVQTAICSSNWSATLSAIGSITFGYRTQFFLSRQADPKTIVVKVNGTVVKESAQDGWTYENSSNSVNFSKSQIPPPGGTVVVEYKAICLP